MSFPGIHLLTPWPMKNYRSYCIVLFAMILFGIACKDDDSGSQSAELKVPSEIVFVGNVKDSVIEITSNLPWTISGPVNHQILEMEIRGLLR